jgi:hypothetical protein
MIQCAICYENIYIVYHKNNNCKCNLRYHIYCINKWFINTNTKQCMICKKTDDFNFNKYQKKINILFTFTTHIIFLFILLVFYVTNYLLI